MMFRLKRWLRRLACACRGHYIIVGHYINKCECGYRNISCNYGIVSEWYEDEPEETGEARQTVQAQSEE